MRERRQLRHAQQTRHTRPRRRRSALRIIAFCVFVAIALAAGTYTVVGYEIRAHYPKDMRGNPVAVSPPSHEVAEQTDAVAAVGSMRLRVPSTGLNVPLGELNEVDGVMDPPGFASAYLVRNYGANLAHATTGTVFVVMHSCRGGDICPGNYLINVAAGEASVHDGAAVYVDGLHYRVTGWQKVYKPDVHDDTAIWADVPGRLVLFTCLQVPAQTESIDNMVITAQLVR